MVKSAKVEQVESSWRRATSSGVRQLEQVLYIVVAVALGLSGVALLVWSFIDFGRSLADDASFLTSILTLLDVLLLVFIVAELLHTIRSVVAENVLLTEPFLIVGIIATIRRLIVISAEATEALGTPRFSDLMIELGVLAGTTLVLGFTLFMIRHTDHSEPRPSHESVLSDPMSDPPPTAVEQPRS